MRLIDADDLYRKVVGYNGGAVDKTVAKRLIEQQPTVQRNSTQSNASNTLNALNALDTIYRQAAIDNVLDLHADHRVSWVDAVIDALETLPSVLPYTDEEIQKIQELEQAEIQKAFQLGREDALSEIIRCKDCKHGMYDVMCKFYWCHGVAHSANWFCADGERREDE